MITSRETSLMTAISNSDPLRPAHFAYFRERTRNNLYDLVLSTFVRGAKENGLKKADLARRLKKRPEQITRWLSGPGNWTLDTATDLLLAMGVELEFSGNQLNSRPARNYAHPLVIEMGKVSSKPAVPSSSGSRPLLLASIELT